MVLLLLFFRYFTFSSLSTCPFEKEFSKNDSVDRTRLIPELKLIVNPDLLPFRGFIISIL